MADRVIVEELRELCVFGVRPGVVGHQSFDPDAVAGEPRQCACGEGGDGRGGLVVAKLDIRQAGVVVDDGVGVAVAGARCFAGAVAGHGVAGLSEPCVAFGVHVQQISGARPLIPVWRLPLGTENPRHPESGEYRVDGRVRGPDPPCDQPRPHPVNARSWRIFSSSFVEVLSGEWCGREERSRRHAQL